MSLKKQFYCIELLAMVGSLSMFKKVFAMNENEMPNSEERMIRLTAVEALTGMSKSSIYRGVKTAAFPSPVRLSARAIAWRATDLNKWLRSRVATSSKVSPLNADEPAGSSLAGVSS